MAQLNSPLKPHSNPKKDEKKSGLPWALIGFFLFVISGPIGFLLAAIAAVVMLIVKLGKNGVFIGKGNLPSSNHDRADQHRADPGYRPERSAKKRSTADPGRAAPAHIHGGLTDHCRAKRLEQLETLKEAGLYSEEEYKAKKSQIIRETANER